MWIKRIMLFVGGLFVMSLGVGLSIKSGLGVTPISSIPYSLTLASGANIGITTIIFNAILVFLQIPILKKRFKAKRLLQLINTVMFGYFTDLSLWILSPMPGLPLDVNFTLLIVSMFLIAVGILIYMPANIAPLPGEGVVEAISLAYNKRFSKVKVCFDTSMVVLSLIICGLFTADIFGSVNIGTILAAIFIGIIIRYLTELYEKITGKSITVVNKENSGYERIKITKELIKRIIYYIIGVCILSFAVGVSIKSELGVTPINSIPYAIALIANIDVGLSSVLFYLVVIFIQKPILKDKYHPKRLLQLVSAFLFGYFVDFSLWVMAPIQNLSLMGKFLMLALSIVLIAVGILIMMPANIAPLPGEGLIEAIAIAADRKFSSVKICIDSSMVIITVILCWIFLGDVLGSVSAGTIISAACTGFVVRQFHDLYRYFTGKDIRVVNKE